MTIMLHSNKGPNCSPLKVHTRRTKFQQENDIVFHPPLRLHGLCFLRLHMRFGGWFGEDRELRFLWRKPYLEGEFENKILVVAGIFKRILAGILAKILERKRKRKRGIWTRGLREDRFVQVFRGGDSRRGIAEKYWVILGGETFGHQVIYPLFFFSSFRFYMVMSNRVVFGLFNSLWLNTFS